MKGSYGREVMGNEQLFGGTPDDERICADHGILNCEMCNPAPKLGRHRDMESLDMLATPIYNESVTPHWQRRPLVDVHDNGCSCSWCGNFHDKGLHLGLNIPPHWTAWNSWWVIKIGKRRYIRWTNSWLKFFCRRRNSGKRQREAATLK